jgi:ATP-binding protein involved in chromosome partitioning
MSNPFDQQKPIPGVKKILVVSSGKGGVGKSTVSIHLALALKEKGLNIGLMDADIYGPSLPRMLGTLNQKPDIHNNLIQPLIVGGLKTMSIGNLVDEDMAVVWRGPMLFKAMNQFLFEVDWSGTDILVIDLPPGTGDIQLSLAQKVPVSAAITVTTPQNIALADVKKSIDMFRRVNVPMLGVVENMAYFELPGGDRTSIFPKGELEDYLKKENLKKLGEVPLSPQIAQACEVGAPLFFKPDSLQAKIFGEIADRILEQLK